MIPLIGLHLPVRLGVGPAPRVGSPLASAARVLDSAAAPVASIAAIAVVATVARTALSRSSDDRGM